MRTPLTIAIDFDDTFTADCEAWRMVIKVLQSRGHQVICVSARYDELGNRQELRQALPDGVPVLLSCNTPKRLFARQYGYEVDIWIDDMPEAIPTKQDLLH